MISIDLANHTYLLAFWLCFARVVTIMFQLPLFDQAGIPGIVKILCAALCSLAFFPTVQGTILREIAYAGEHAFWVLTIFHTLSGLFIGFLVKSIMTMFVTSGAVITQQVGLGAAKYFDPTMGQQIGPLESVIHWVMLLMILGSGALIPMFKGIVVSFEALTIFKLALLTNITPYYIKLFSQLFESAILLASPLIFTNIILTLIMGIIARMVPQMNILMVSFVVYIGAGLFVFSIISYDFFQVGYRHYVNALGTWFQYLR